MTFLADESVEAEVVARLRQAGHTVGAVAESAAGSPDDAVLAAAVATGGRSGDCR